MRLNISIYRIRRVPILFLLCTQFVLNCSFEQAFSQVYLSEAPNPETRTLNTTYKVGATPGSFNVAPDGSAAYTIPIPVPPGTAGLQPSVTINYNSNTGDGILGKGWSLSALSVISRTPSSHYYDGSADPVDFDSDDAFVMDGTRLVKDGLVYKTDPESFAVITPVLTNGIITKFEVKTKEGKILEYGNDNAKLQNTENGQYFAWYLSKVTDAFGNYMSFIFANDATSGIRLTEIKYTGNSGAGLTPYNSIFFEYGNRTDSRVGYVYGQQVPFNLLLKKIRCTAEGSAARTYDFNYIYNTNASLLAEIIETGSDGTRLNSTVFSYHDYQGGSEYTDLNLYDSFDKELYGDINGDGRTDLFLRSGSYVKYYTTNPGGQEIAYLGQLNIGSSDFEVGDFNGDGLDDIVVYSGSAIQYYQSSGAGFSYVSASDVNLTDILKVYAYDVNGDYIDDLIIKRSSSLSVYRGNESDPFNESFNSSFTWKSEEYFHDFNGDGKVDVFLYGSSSHAVYQFLNTGCELLYTASHSPARTVTFGDFNGDRKMDFLLGGKAVIDFHTGEEAYTGTTFLGNGKSFTQKEFIPAADLNKEYVAAFDSDGDGKHEIYAYTPLVPTPYDPDEYRCDKYIFNGEQFSYVETKIIQLVSKEMDFNGDGIMDAKCNLWNGNIGFKYYYKGDTKHRLYMIADGLNNKTVISYDNIGNNEIYTPAATPVSYPYNKYNAPQYVVGQLQQSNGLGGYFTTTYQYAGGISFRPLNGFMGFLQTRVASLETLLTQQTDYLFDPVYPYVSKVDNLVTDSQGSNVSKTEEEFTVTHIANKRVRRDLWHRNTWNYLDNTSTQGTWWTNSYGNTTHQQTVYSGQTGSDDVYYENYITLAGSPVPNAAQTIREVHIRSGKPAFERRMSIDYNAANGFINSKVIDPDKPKPLTISFVPVSSGLGLIWKEQVSGTDITTRESVYQWDSKGRYIATSQSPEGQLTQTLRDAKTGNILSETLPTGFTDQSSYDGFGRLSYNKASDQTIFRNWYSGSLANCVWYEQITSPSQPERFVYYDRLGREIEIRTRAFETGKDILVHTTYNNKGQKASVSGPYFSGAAAYTTVFSYDPYGRPVEENYDTNTRRITYTYNPKQVVISNSSLWPSQTETREYDDTGALVKVKDHNNSELTYSYNSTGQVDLIQTPNGNVTTQYDAYGRPQQVTDPDAGTVTYDYYATGEVKTQTKNGNTSSFTYNRNGQIKTIGMAEGTTTYTYNGTTGLLNFIDGISGNDVSVGYDAIGRVNSRTETVEGVNYAFGYTYADGHTGRVQTVTYPGNFGVSYGYTGGYLNEIRNTSGNGLIWQLQETSPQNQPEVFTNGNNLVTTRTCDYRTGQLTRIQTGSVQDLEYSIQPSTGNMSWRRDNKHNLREDFGYDGLNRLTSVAFGGNTMDIGYSATGNITGKQDAGSYHYQEPQPHAVSAITPWGSYSPENQTAAYTSFDKLQSLAQGNKSLAITYGYDQQRRKSVFTKGTSTKTKIYIPGGYEKITEGTTIREFYYISTPAGITAVYEKVNGAGAMYYVHTDHLGSVHMITNSTGGVVQELSYDAWGRQRNATNWSYADLPVPKFERGFTFHEQLTGFDLINMNGRMYDPVVGRFLSPDPVLQSPDNLQNYNRYSYCLNNPLKYTDPSGYKLRAAEMVDMGGGDGGWWSVWGRYGGGESSKFFSGSSSGGGFGGGFGGGGYNSSSWYMGTMYNPDGSINYPGPSSETAGAWFDSGLNSMMSLGDFNRYYSAGVSIRTINETRQLDWTRRNGERYLRGVRLTYSETWTSTSAANGGGDWLNETWNWAKDHFYIGAEGEITYGVQLAGTLKNGLGLNISPYHQVKAEGSISNRGKFTLNGSNKLKIMDFGAAYYVGVNYNQTIDYSNSYWGKTTNTMSIGALGVFGVTLNFNDNWNFIGGYGGVDISGKAAVIWGASGSLKIGFEF